VLLALALAALALLPGLLVVRAPWTVVPALSLGFWVLSAWWPPLSGLSRGRVVAALLSCFLLVALLRLLPKHEVEPPPGWTPPPAPPTPRPAPAPPRLLGAPSLSILLVVLLLLAPLPLWHHAPGKHLAFQTTMARILVWRDGVPRSADPLLPLAPVGAHAPAIATLAADIARLSGADPGPSVLVVTVASAGLALVGLFGLLATWAEPRAAALGSLLALAVVPWPGFLVPLGAGEALLALVFLLPAAALLVGHESRSSALAAGLLLGAAALAQPVLAALATAGATAVALGSVPTRSRRWRVRRVAEAVALGLVLAAPGLFPLARALSPREALAIGSSLRLGELPDFAIGLLGATLARLVAVRLVPARSRRAGGLVAAACAVSAILLVVRVHGWVAAGQLDPHTRAALLQARSGSPVAPLCAPPEVLDWVPALAGRPAGEPGPWIPPVYAEEWLLRPRRVCRDRLWAPPPP
jgi:hypothetical protein